MWNCFFYFTDTATSWNYTYWHSRSLHDALPVAARLAVCGVEKCWTRHGVLAERGHRYPKHCHRQMRSPYAVFTSMLYLLYFVPQPNYLSSPLRSEEPTSELQSLMRISYAVFCLPNKQNFIPLLNNITYPH